MSKMNFTRQSVEAIIAERIEPLFALDRGSLEVVDVDEEKECVQVRFGGSYSGAPCRETLFLNVVEPILKESLVGLSSLIWVD